MLMIAYGSSNLILDLQRVTVVCPKLELVEAILIFSSWHLKLGIEMHCNNRLELEHGQLHKLSIYRSENM